MLNDARDSMGAALLALNYSLNSSSPKEITEAGRLLKAQRRHAKAYRYINLGESSELINGSIHMTLGYNGDAMVLKAQLGSIDFFSPEARTELWADFIGVFETGENKEAAFISEELGTASSNLTAEEFMSAEHLSNPLIYPPKEVLERSEFLQPLSARATRMYNSIFNNITR